MHSSTEIHNYIIDRLIGNGAFSEVYLAVHKLIGTKVAIKIINYERIGEEDLICLIREITIHLQLEHPNIAFMYEFFIESPYVYIVMEYVTGGTLLDHINGKRNIAENTVRNYLIDILSSLFYLHRGRSVSHRDIKPQNILISNEGALKLIDFGFSNCINSKGFDSFVGTPGFTAPEIIDDGYYDESCDIFSLGVCIYSMIAGHFPFDLQNTNSERLLSQIGELEIPPTVSPELQRLIRMMIDPNPSTRLTLDQILCFPWVQEVVPKNDRFSYFLNPIDIRFFLSMESLNMAHRKPVLDYKKSIIESLNTLGFDKKKALDEIRRGIVSSESAAYFMLSKNRVIVEDPIPQIVPKKSSSSSRHIALPYAKTKAIPRAKKPIILPSLSGDSIQKPTSRTQIPNKKGKQIQ